jgi:Kef-type K+ transport system membrane component KefB
MDTMPIVGIMIFTGFLFGEIAQKIRLPKITGYILAGICLNPRLLPLIPKSFTEHTDFVTNISLAFITFSVGGTLLYSKIKALGKTILAIVLFEAEGAFFMVITGFISVTLLLGIYPVTSWKITLLPLSLLLGCLASPTDPSSTLAVTHEYKAQGNVTSTIMGVAAFDDALGIMNYSLAVAGAQLLIAHTDVNLYSALLRSLVMIGGGILLGALFGLVFNWFTILMKGETEGALIVLIFAMLALCFGIAQILQVDELLATMAMGCLVVNFNLKQDTIFKMLERYTEELIFVFFFTLSGMYLNFSVLSGAFLLIVLFVVFRAIGKVGGTVIGASFSKASKEVKHYTALGLLPQGGIVIGLALMINANPAFDTIADSLISIVIGATVIHELIGPIVAKIALQKAGEISN